MFKLAGCLDGLQEPIVSCVRVDYLQSMENQFMWVKFRYGGSRADIRRRHWLRSGIVNKRRGVKSSPILDIVEVTFAQ